MEQRTARSKTKEAVPRLDPLPRVVHMIEEKGGGDRAREGTMAGGETNKEREYRSIA